MGNEIKEWVETIEKQIQHEIEKINLNDIIIKDYSKKFIYFEALLQSAEVRKMKNDGYFLQLTVINLGKQLDITQFNCSQEASANFVVGKVYHFVVEVREYAKGKDGVSCILETFLESNSNSEDFIKWEDGAGEAYQLLLSYLDTVKHTDIGTLTYNILNKYWKTFSRYPAASSFHHKYLGGLLVHTCCVTELSRTMGEFYNKWYGENTVNINLLLCGAMLHDIGKVQEFVFNEEFCTVEYSDDSFLLNHVASGMLIIQEEAAKLNISGRQEVRELLHLIASHHGRLEWGSPIETHCIESDILSYSDQVDATVNRRINLNKDMVSGTGKSVFVGGARIANYKVTKEDKQIEL